MQQLQIIFDRIKETKRGIRVNRKMYKDALAADSQYTDILEKIKSLKVAKKQIELHTQEELGKVFEEIKRFQLDIKLDKELMADIAVSELMKGTTVEVLDEKVKLGPVFSVKFKKA